MFAKNITTTTTTMSRNIVNQLDTHNQPLTHATQLVASAAAPAAGAPAAGGAAPAAAAEEKPAEEEEEEESEEGMGFDLVSLRARAQASVTQRSPIPPPPPPPHSLTKRTLCSFYHRDRLLSDRRTTKKMTFFRQFIFVVVVTIVNC